MVLPSFSFHRQFVPLLCLCALTCLAVKCKCPPSIKLGETTLQAPSRDFLVYSGKEQLIFVDSNGNEIRLTASDTLTHRRTRAYSNELCAEGFFDFQVEYIEGDHYEVKFGDETYSFYFRVSNSSVHSDLSDSLIILFDLLEISGAFGGKWLGQNHLVTSDHGTPISADHLQYLNLPRQVADTVFHGKRLEDVYFWGIRGFFPVLFFDPDSGLVAVEMDSMSYLILDRIE